MHAFEEAMQLRSEDIEFDLTAFGAIPWAEFLLNPRRLRGSDFLMRWSQGLWSEQRMVEAINSDGEFYAIPYGPSSVAPQGVREFELYFIDLEKANMAKHKRPDLLVFNRDDQGGVDKFLAQVGGAERLPFIPEDELRPLLDQALAAIECENSLWVANKMPHYGKPLKKQKWLAGGIGLPKAAVTPTIIIKEEDRTPLLAWQHANQVPIHIWHNFFDRAYGITLDYADELIRTSLIRPTENNYQAPNGASTKKLIYKIYYHYAYQLAESTEEPTLLPAHIQDKNGHILPYVTFSGGKLKLDDAALDVLRELRDARE